MTAPELFLLAIDHRRSFERLFEIDGPIGDADRERLATAKTLVVEALASVADVRPDLGGVGVLIDDDYGAEALATARRLGVTTAVAFERSGRAVLEFEHDDWRERLDALGDGFAKVLVRHRADGDPVGNAAQLERLRAISEACAKRPARFLLELLTPYSSAERSAHDEGELERTVRPALILDAIAQIQAAGVEADVWKVEGVADAGRCAEIAAQAQAGGRDDVGVVVLGAGAPAETVNEWLAAAAAGGYSGFAVGRSIWVEALRDHDGGTIDAPTARERIAANYLTFVDTFRAA